MKKICLSGLAATALFFSVETATAQVYEETSSEQQTEQKKDMEQIQVEELPNGVQQAVERDFQGATISEAYVKEKEGETKYKVVITTLQGETRELYADAQGNWIEKEGKTQK